MPGAGLVAYLGSTLARAQDWHPPGSLFLVFSFGACSAALHEAGDVLPALLVTGGSVLFAVLVEAAGGRLGGPRSAPVALRWQRSWLPVRDAAAVLVGGTVAVTLGIGHPYWAMVAALAPLSVALVCLVAVLQFATELVVGRNDGLAMLFITPLALLMGQTVARVPPGVLLFDRGRAGAALTRW